MLAGALPAQVAGLPPEQRVGDAAFIAGGAEDPAAAAFRGAMARYPLAIEVVQSNAGRPAPTTGATVELRRRSGEVMFNTRADGPFVLARVPPGDYTVDATLNGRTLTRDVTVPATGNARAVISFAGE
jgi:hypothetical protein